MRALRKTNLCTSSDSQRAIISSGERPERSMAKKVVKWRSFVGRLGGLLRMTIVFDVSA